MSATSDGRETRPVTINELTEGMEVVVTLGGKQHLEGTASAPEIGRLEGWTFWLTLEGDYLRRRISDRWQVWQVIEPGAQ